MKFITLAQHFAELETTASRNSMMEILADLLKQATSDETYRLVHLSLGGLAPKFARIEFNVADKMIIKAISRAMNQSAEAVTTKFKSSGDLGDVTQYYFSSNKSTKPGKYSPTVIEIFDQLLIIAQASGQGSQEEKIRRLATLLTNLDPISAKYVVRIVLNKLRLGFSDKTILDSLSYMEQGSKMGRADLDWSYQVHPDVGQIASLVKTYGIKKAKSKVAVKLGVPVMPALAQRLKSAADMITKMGTVMAEPKFDGTRVQIHFDRNRKADPTNRDLDELFSQVNSKSIFWVKSFTRNLDESSHMFPELLSIANQIKAQSVILDSEAVGYDKKTGSMLPFQLTITRKRKHGIKDIVSTVPLKFYVFDILYKNDQSLISIPLQERRQLLEDTIDQKVSGPLVIDDYLITDDPIKLKTYHQKQLTRGLEGAMVKKIQGAYTPGRLGWNWVKFKEAEDSQAKLSDTLDCLVMGYYKGQGKRSTFGIGAFLVGVKSGDEYLTIAKIGTGLSDEQWLELKSKIKNHKSKIKPKEYGDIHKILVPDVWVNPHLVVEVAADEITKSPTHSSGSALRFPRLVRFRLDKSPNQVTTKKELKSITS